MVAAHEKVWHRRGGLPTLTLVRSWSTMANTLSCGSSGSHLSTSGSGSGVGCCCRWQNAHCCLLAAAATGSMVAGVPVAASAVLVAPSALLATRLNALILCASTSSLCIGNTQTSSFVLAFPTRAAVVSIPEDCVVERRRRVGLVSGGRRLLQLEPP